MASLMAPTGSRTGLLRQERDEFIHLQLAWLACPTIGRDTSSTARHPPPATRRLDPALRNLGVAEEVVFRRGLWTS
jgi:hypothetical protein